jgi:hypothetical protein
VKHEDVVEVRAAIDAGLPETFRGWPVFYGWDAIPVSHHVETTTLSSWLGLRLGHDPLEGMAAVDWLVIPQQQLLGTVRGGLYHDGLGEVEPLRSRLAWYPDQVWRWMVACQWRKISQEEAFVGRAAEVGDVVGSRVTCARLVREVMRLHFLLAQTYAPYTKWFGSAYRQLPGGEQMLAKLERALDAVDDRSRQVALGDAYEAIAELHNRVGLTQPLDTATRRFYGRPFTVLRAERFVDACLDSLDDEWLRSLPLIGSIDQFTDSTDVTQYPKIAQRLRVIYERAGEAAAR